jgi:hypothetical protein
MARKIAIQQFEKTMQMGLGEAIQRLLHVEMLRSRGIAQVPEHAIEEKKMLIEALNSIPLDLGFDCDLDGVPDSIEIFARSAQTSCCRILPSDTSRRQPKTATRKKPATSRRKKK